MHPELERALLAIESIMEITGTPGVSIGIIRHGQTAETYHLGYRDVQNKLQADDDTRYNINSLSKGLVSALVGMEVHRGGLDWFKPIKTWLPGFSSASKELDENCSIVDLLSHRTGLASLDDFWMGAENVIYLNKSQVLPTFQTLPISRPFRESLEYNNWGYDIAAQVLEKIANRTISDLLHGQVFAPLGMSRTSTAWEFGDDNEGKCYGILQDLSPVEVARPALGNGTAMEAAGGIKSTLRDMLTFYKTFMHETNLQFSSGSDASDFSPLKNCRMLTTNHARLPGVSWREQGYGLGWGRSQLPGRLGLLSGNTLFGEGPIVGKGNSSLVLWHHGCMPGSTSVVYLAPEVESGVVVLQNSMPVIDTADIIGQLVLEAILRVEEPNDYVALSKQWHDRGVNHLRNLQKELDDNKTHGTKPRPLSTYTGTYWNEPKTFFITVQEQAGSLVMTTQGLSSQAYTLQHYHHDSFT
ncbi:beta-lactamase/transpeptidase-like protein [Chaetomium fimeti]|uniref:Beta-lactamase/transpeptidase-like protein n=1 Tax=Chaetomium fimeti TaxID=1854472 RepID=A0AAE0HDF9_9PEZI|nr:beta-lactamase/transpeptidase-like protein [Chaetomium fimeti]